MVVIIITKIITINFNFVVKNGLTLIHYTPIFKKKNKRKKN